MENLFTIQKRHSNKYSVWWARKQISKRADMSDDPRSQYRSLMSWAREYTHDCIVVLREVRISSVQGLLTAKILREQSEAFRNYRQLARAYRGAAERIYIDVMRMAEKMQMFVENGCKSHRCDVCEEPEFVGDPHQHDADDYMHNSPGRGRGDREDFHADG